MNWDMETNYICPTVVHHSSNNSNNNNYVNLTECVLQTSPTTTIMETPQTTRLSTKKKHCRDRKRETVSCILLIIDNDDGIGNNTQQQSTKQNFTNFANTDLNGKRKFNTIVRIHSKEEGERESYQIIIMFYRFKSDPSSSCETSYQT